VKAIMLTIHHLGHSQSERIIWLCEELAIPYDLRRYARDPITRLSPPDLVALHPLGAAPLINDGNLLLAESAAIVDYILVKYGNGQLRIGVSASDYAAYLYWFHFSNGNLQPVMSRLMIVSRTGVPADHPVQASAQMRLDRVLKFMDARLSEVKYLAGSEFTAADIMSVFSLTTMRLFQPVDLKPYGNILGYLQRIGARPAYQRAMAKGDPDLVPLLD
jgi:glutathione S-transferase